jgi:hypothetical protein
VARFKKDNGKNGSNITILFLFILFAIPNLIWAGYSKCRVGVQASLLPSKVQSASLHSSLALTLCGILPAEIHIWKIWSPDCQFGLHLESQI